MRIPHRSRNVLHIGLIGVMVMALAGLLGADNAIADNAQPVAKAQIQESYGKLPLYFEANRGQTDRQVKFLSRSAHHTLFLTQDEAVFVMHKVKAEVKDKGLSPVTRHLPRLTRHASRGYGQTVLRMKFVGANPKTRVKGQKELPGKANYFIGNDPKKWRTNVPTYAKVQYRDLYPGINLVYYDNRRRMEFDFLLAPGANPNLIRLEVKGADRLDVDARGDLVLHARGGQLRLQKPAVYQDVKGIRQEVSGRYVLTDSYQIGFQLGAYDATRPVIIDPVLFYSTYLGGGGDDVGNSIAVDESGDAYVTGQIDSTNFPTTPGAFQATSMGGGDAFVTKLNDTGSGLVYSTYLGGSGSDVGRGIAVDTAGSAYVAGFTGSTNFPTSLGAFQTTYGGGTVDAFVAKVNLLGSGLVYSTYLGGSDFDASGGIAVDAAGNAYVTGGTSSTNFPTTTGAFQTAFGGGPEDAFVAKITEGPVPPGQTMERVTGGGTINVVGGIGSFSFIVQRAASTGALSGRLQYFNHASGAQVQSQSISSLMIIGNTATFGGTCTVNGTSCTFTVNVTDNGEPGTTDTFAISVSGGPTEGGTLRGGNILIAQ